MDYRIELVVLPVADVDRAKAFYVDEMGFAVDVDHDDLPRFRVVQVTPPGSACSVSFGINLGPDMPPGSMQGLHLVVRDIEAAHAELKSRGVELDEIVHFGPNGREPGLDPARADYGSFSSFKDPDGNSWVLQEVPSRPS